MDAEKRKEYNRAYYQATHVSMPKKNSPPTFTFTEEEMKRAVREYQCFLKWKKKSSDLTMASNDLTMASKETVSTYQLSTQED